MEYNTIGYMSVQEPGESLRPESVTVTYCPPPVHSYIWKPIKVLKVKEWIKSRYVIPEIELKITSVPVRGEVRKLKTMIFQSSLSESNNENKK
jgi:hypothetical protein